MAKQAHIPSALRFQVTISKTSYRSHVVLQASDPDQLVIDV